MSRSLTCLLNRLLACFYVGVVGVVFADVPAESLAGMSLPQQAAVMVGPDGSRQVVVRDPKTADGCPTAPPATGAASAVTSSADSAGSTDSNSQQQRDKPLTDGPSGTTGSAHVSQHTTGDKGAKRHSPSTKQQQKEPVLNAVADATGGSSSSSSGRRRRWLLLHQQHHHQQRQQQAVAVKTLVTGSLQGGSTGRQLQRQSPEFSADADSAGVLTDSSKGDSSQSLDEAVAGSSSSKGRVACWRQVHGWPFGEDGRVWGFNQAGDGLYVTSSVGR